MSTDAATHHRHWNAATQTASRERLDALHLQRIRHLVGWAYDHSPLHRRLYDDAGVKPADIRTWDDYHRRLPFTDKPDYVADQESSQSGFGGIALPQQEWQQYFHTTGTTGRFLNEAFGHYEMHKAGSQYCYGLWDHGIRAQDSIYFCFDFGMWIGLWSYYWGARNLGLTIVSGGGASGVQRVRQILERRPTIVCGTPTYLLHLAEIARREGLDVREAGVRMLAGGGEAGFSVPGTRERLRQAWGVEQVYDAYGIGEALFIGQSCVEWGGGVHGIEDVCHSYSVDPDSGDPVASGEVGEHVITSYTHFTQPFIKYRTHDLVRIDDRPDHGCGWTWKHFPVSCWAAPTSWSPSAASTCTRRRWRTWSARWRGSRTTTSCTSAASTAWTGCWCAPRRTAPRAAPICLRGWPRTCARTSESDWRPTSSPPERCPATS